VGSDGLRYEVWVAGPVRIRPPTPSTTSTPTTRMRTRPTTPTTRRMAAGPRGVA